MAIRAVVTRGYGNGTFIGTIKDVVLRGYSFVGAVAGWYPEQKRRIARYYFEGIPFNSLREMNLYIASLAEEIEKPRPNIKKIIRKFARQKFVKIVVQETSFSKWQARQYIEKAVERAIAKQVEEKIKKLMKKRKETELLLIASLY